MGYYHLLGYILLGANNRKLCTRVFPFQWCAMQASDISAAFQARVGLACCNYQQVIVRNEMPCLPAGACSWCFDFSPPLLMLPPEAAIFAALFACSSCRYHSLQKLIQHEACHYPHRR